MYYKFEVVWSAAGSELVGIIFFSALRLLVVLTGDAGRAGKAPVASGTGRLGTGTGALRKLVQLTGPRRFQAACS